MARHFSTPSRRRIWSKVAFIVALLVAGSIHLTPSVSGQSSTAKIPASQIIKSDVRAFVVNCETTAASNGDSMGVPKTDTCESLGSGSGTIISQDGKILTNAHVALNEETKQPQWLLIAITTDPRELPTAAFFGRAIIYDANVDLAVVAPVYTLDGRTIEEGDVNLLPLPMAKSDKSVDLEQPIRMIGYPGVGGDTITIDPAVVSGFAFDPRVPELAGSAWIKTDPSGGAGISGGSTVNDDGILVGVPSAGGLAEIRCVDVNGDGTNDPATECAATAGESGYSRPIPEAYNLLLKKAGEASPTPGVGQPTATATPEVPLPPDDGVIISGSVVSADTGDPIDGATVVVFKPGVGVQKALDEQNPDNVFAIGQSDSRGAFILNNPVTRGQAYGIAAFAPGYGTVGGDDIVLAKDSDPPTVDIGAIKLPVSQ